MDFVDKLDNLKVGDTLDWRHGDSIRIAKVLIVDGPWVYVRGSSKSYWISKKELSEKLTKPESYGRSQFSSANM